MKKGISFKEANIDDEKKRIGIRLRQIRKSLGFTSHETFAYENGFDRAQYGKYEAGSLNITLGSLLRILNKMSVTLSTFFNEEYDEIDVIKEEEK